MSTQEKNLSPPSGGVSETRESVKGTNKSTKNSLVGNVLIFDTAVDKAGQLVGGLLDVSRLLGDGELLEELIKDLG